MEQKKGEKGLGPERADEAAGKSERGGREDDAGGARMKERQAHDKQKLEDDQALMELELRRVREQLAAAGREDDDDRS